MSRRPTPPRFRRPSTRRGPFARLTDWWLLWRVPVLLLLVMTAWWFVFRPIAQEQGWVRVTERFAVCAGGGEREAGCVVDGDTVVIGFGPQQRRIRLTGFDAPELDGACAEETRLAIAARDRLHQWLGEGPFEWNGAEDPPYDQYGRELRAARRVAADGSSETLAEAMIASGLASESGWGTEERDWCA